MFSGIILVRDYHSESVHALLMEAMAFGHMLLRTQMRVRIRCETLRRNHTKWCTTRIIICTIIFQFISFHHNFFQKVSILDCFPLPSLSCYHCFASLSDEQEASKSHCLLWVLYFLHRLLIFEYIAYGTVHFIALHCNEVNCLSISQNEFCRGWMSYAMIDILNESIL